METKQSVQNAGETHIQNAGETLAACHDFVRTSAHLFQILMAMCGLHSKFLYVFKYFFSILFRI